MLTFGKVKISEQRVRFTKGILLIKPDFRAEINWWKEFIPSSWELMSNSESWKKIFPKELMGYIVDLKKTNNGRIKLLEVGSGPVSLLALAAVENLCDIVAVDPLAKEYEKIMTDKGYFYPVKPIRGKGEKLLDLFSANTFDMVYSSNALDHMQSPGRAFKNMYNVTKKGGIIFIEGLVNEGKRTGYSGLHRFNLFPEKGILYYSRWADKAIDISSGLKLECIFLKISKAKDRGYGPLYAEYVNHQWFTIIFRKS
jgi:ubiquinone/menaquinone biosynthesis C-methylase UbiE